MTVPLETAINRGGGNAESGGVTRDSATIHLGCAGWSPEQDHMNESINRKFAVASKIKYPDKVALTKVRCAPLLAVLVLVNLSSVAFAQSSSCSGIHIKIQDIRNSTGTIGCALFKSPDGFPTEYLRYATNIIVTKIQDTQATCDFTKIPSECMHLPLFMMKI